MSRGSASDDDLSTALSWLRAAYLLHARGHKHTPRPVNQYTADRAFNFLKERYEAAEARFDAMIPTNRFTDDELWVLAAMKYHMITEAKLCDTDPEGWHYTRTQLTRHIAEGEVDVLGSEPAPLYLKEIITNLQHKLESTGWVTRKRGFTGVATYIEPTEHTNALFDLPIIREGSPTLIIPAFADLGVASIKAPGVGITPPSLYPPEAIREGDQQPSLPASHAASRGSSPEGSGLAEWVTLESLLINKINPVAQWNYHTSLRGQMKAVVLRAMRRVGIAVRDVPRAEAYGPHYRSRERWVRLPSSVSKGDLVKLVESVCGVVLIPRPLHR